ncbi:hypothetical protein [Iningainema tapete]|uniref:Uncharacterized protein n=1 Tax=Iningainema tapete BLCC-T55 TaxID=2748662 RepID=A0A8J6XC35_9CYAN|nr:hypothetical protein [Iningainema tapete]MBD2772149.1 hypothetical protein [Iningainema tapete BLCC-T55]
MNSNIQTYSKIRLIYFKNSGKFYTNGNLDLLPEEISTDGKLALMWKISQRVKQLSISKKLPAVNSNWLENECFIMVDVPRMGYPCLLLPSNKEKLFSTNSTQYKPVKTQKSSEKELPSIRLIYFREYGKFDDEATLEMLPSDKSDDGKVALIYNICDRIEFLNEQGKLPGRSSKWLYNNGYIMVEIPDAKISSCPHLILPRIPY